MQLASTTGNRADRFLPPDPRVEEPYLFTPRMALRVAILAAIALAVFAVLLLRLWSLQVLSGSKYEAAARNNQLRTFPIEAPAWPDPRPERPHARHERSLDRGRRRPDRPAEAGSLRGDEAAFDGPQRAAPQAARTPRAGDEEPADSGDDAGRGPSRPGRLPRRAQPGVPRCPDHPDLPAQVQHRGAARARPRLRRGDFSGAARPLQEALQDLPDHPGEGGERSLPGRQDRPGRSGAERRQVPPRPLRREAPAGRLARRQGRQPGRDAGADGRFRRSG